VVQDIIKQSSDIPDPDKTKDVQDKPQMLEEIVIEELSIDGICGVY
jgi:mycofactocin precursor